MTTLQVLIVDDDQDFADSLAELITDEGYKTYTVYSGQSAVDTIKKKHIDLVFLDIRMSDMNGLQTYENIRAIKPQMHIAMMTGYTDEDIINTLLKKGAITILYKPISIQDIVMILDNTANQKIILIVDDDHDFTQSLKLMLEERGNRTLIATSSIEAVNLSRIENIKIILLDLRLDGENGLDVFLAMKQTGLDFKTIVITAYSEEEIHQINQLHSLSVESFLQKPFNPETLINTINSE